MAKECIQCAEKLEEIDVFLGCVICNYCAISLGNKLEKACKVAEGKLEGYLLLGAFLVLISFILMAEGNQLGILLAIIGCILAGASNQKANEYRWARQELSKIETLTLTLKILKIKSFYESRKADRLFKNIAPIPSADEISNILESR